MKIVRLLGGLGNQMFQYAFALSLKKEFPDETILLDKTCFTGYPLHQGYELDKIFKIALPYARKRDIIHLNYPYFHYRLWQIGKRLLPPLKTVYYEKEDMTYDNNLLDCSGSTYYDGYWQTEKYFIKYKEDILKNYSFPAFDKRTSQIWSKLSGKRLASVHVRRGDYLKNPLFKGITDLEYYRRAIFRLLEMTSIDKFLIFSNDIEWCQAHLQDFTSGIPCLYVDWNKNEHSYRDMQLMSLCHHNIVANSSFSWWAAWLNQNPEKIVIAPHKWINKIYPNDIIPSSWIKI